MTDFVKTAQDNVISKTIQSLHANGMQAEVVENLDEAKAKVLNKIPEGSKVFTATSVTLIETGLDTVLNEPPYESVRGLFTPLYGQPDKALEMKRLGSAADVSVGSVHAITRDGQLMIASRTGSQIPNIAYGAAKVIFVVGAQKLVGDLNEGLDRIKEHSVPLEDARAQEAYGTGTRFNKLLVINSEDDPERIHVVIVKQAVGY